MPSRPTITSRALAAWDAVAPYAKVCGALSRSPRDAQSPPSSRGRGEGGEGGSRRPPARPAPPRPPAQARPPPTPALRLHHLPLPQTLLHVGYIPAIILAGMYLTKPRPTLVQLVGPM